jgi:hypothetical protein
MKPNAVLLDIFTSNRVDKQGCASRLKMDVPAPILSIATVLDLSAEGGRGSLGG